MLPGVGMSNLAGCGAFMGSCTSCSGAPLGSCRGPGGPGSDSSGDSAINSTDCASCNPSCGGSDGCTVDWSRGSGSPGSTTNYHIATGCCTNRGAGGSDCSHCGAATRSCANRSSGRTGLSSVAGRSASTITFLSAADRAEDCKYSYEREDSFHFFSSSSF